MVFMDHVCEGGEQGTGAKFDGFVEGEKAIKKGKRISGSVWKSPSIFSREKTEVPMLSQGRVSLPRQKS